MSVVGFQDFWVTGTRFYFKREDQAGIEQPLLDLGVIQTASPKLEVTNITLDDADGGIKQIADQLVTKISEAYDITCSNLNHDNLGLMFLSNSPAAFTQSAAAQKVAHYSWPGRLVKIKDSAGVPLFSLSAIAGVYAGTAPQTRVITGIVASTKTITFSGGAFSPALTNGDPVIVSPTGLANIANAKTYTVASSTSTTCVVVETVAADETAITGELIGKASGTTIYTPTTDFVVQSLDRGILKMVSTGAFSVAGNITPVIGTNAISGLRLLNPQSLKGIIKGKGWLYYGREGNNRQTVREAIMTLSPSSANFSVDDFSNFVLNAQVITDLTQTTDVAGRLIGFKGSLPTTS